MQKKPTLRPLAASVHLAISGLMAGAILSNTSCAIGQTTNAQPDNTAVLSTIQVQASADASAAGLPENYAGDQVARGGRVGMLGNVDLMDSPFNSTAYTAELIQNQQARSVSDVVQNDPSVRVARGFGNFQELYVIRGLPVFSDDMAYNGLYGLLPRQYVAAELIERAEVFRGANTFLNGAAPGGSGIGGAINLLPKRAPNDPLSRVTTGLESSGQVYVAADLARRFGPDQRTGLRLNAAKRDGSTGIDREKRELDVISLGADYRGNDFRLSADIGYQNHHIDAPRPSVTPNGGIPTAPDARRNFALPWTYSSERQTFSTVRGEFDLNANMTAWVAAGMREGTESNVLANPSATSSGVTSAFRFDNAREDSVKTAEAGLRGKLRTGSVSHTWAATASNFQSSSRNAYAFSNFAGFAGSLTAPFDVAIPAANFFTGGSLNAPLVTERIDMRSIALADTLSFAQDRVLLTVGARHQNIQQNAYNYDTGVLESAYDKSRLTPMTGIVFKANPHLSLYANYIEGLAKGDVAPATSGGQPVTNAGSALSPYQSKQKEIGVKYDEGNVGASLALFSTEKPFGIVQDTVFQAAGEQRNQGAEVSVFGEAARGLRLLGGVTFLDAKQTRTSDGATDGKTAIGVPKTQINLGTEWDVPNATGMTLTARALYTSSQYADAANTLSVPAWTRLDLGARYATKINNQKVTFRARLDNATNSNYWASVGGYPGANYMVLGTPRIFSINASIDF